MKREWYNYASTIGGMSPERLKETLPQQLRERLPRESFLNRGVCADANDTDLVADLDRALRVGKTRDIIRDLRAEVDRRSVCEYEFYLLSLPHVLPVRSGGRDQLETRSVRDFVTQVDFQWTWTPEDLLARELLGLPSGMMDRVLLLTPQARELFKGHSITGVRYSQVRQECWLAEVTHRVPCHADDIILGQSYDAATRSVAGAIEFGLRYERHSVAQEDLQLIDRVIVGQHTYCYRMPWLVASRRFVELCLTHKVDRLQFPNVIFKRGLVPVLVGRGYITSSLKFSE